MITVDNDGRAKITIPANAEDAVFAAHVGPEVQYTSYSMLHIITCFSRNPGSLSPERLSW